MNIKVKCKNCDWEGQAVVGQKISRYSHEQGYKLNQYYCPKCGHDLIRGKGTYDYYSEKAKLKGTNRDEKR